MRPKTKTADEQMKPSIFKNFRSAASNVFHLASDRRFREYYIWNALPHATPPGASPYFPLPCTLWPAILGPCAPVGLRGDFGTAFDSFINRASLR